MDKHGLQIYYTLSKKPFFRRFSQDKILKYLKKAKVEYFNKGEIIFLKNRIAVINHGSVRVVSH